ncbi:PhyH-domain-containing protein [Violaceomyces palustris]|uniref:PhyH-domain-containing protein n=1 Tax=Violaceomyces palustris TaxID=1673888 RepID=A0ACD0NW44_9BASI|nr:PhyH-domain-containing protein [Violaceomyces palustris]
MPESKPIWDQEYRLSDEQLQDFSRDGFLIFRDLFPEEAKRSIVDWSREVQNWPNVAGKWMPYLELKSDGKMGLCRTEKFVDYHEGFKSLFRGTRLRGLLEVIQGEEMVLFKEKINYKEANGGGGFDAHIDAPAYQHAGALKHLTVNIAVDPANLENGCLEVVVSSHKMKVPIDDNNCIEKSWEESQTWTPVPLSSGDVLVFGSFLAHRSGPNRSDRPRAAIYATFNAFSDGGDRREAYYEKRRKEWPPTFERVQGEDYSEGAKRYGFGSPMAGAEVHSRLQLSENPHVTGRTSTVV